MRLIPRVLTTVVFAAATLNIAWAADEAKVPLNTVTLQLSAEQWVSTKTALVNVGVNASLSNMALEKMQNQILAQLEKLSKQAEWHLASFERSQDKSGLERVEVRAEARIPEAELANIRDKAKAISKPGETYTVDDIQFTPSNPEVNAAKSVLRDDIYHQALAELARLNKSYPEQKYYLHEINFMGQVQPVMYGKAMMQAQVMADNAAAPSSPPLAVSQKLQLDATVVLASMLPTKPSATS